ncbi:RDD family protein [Burkholderia lata]|uniref:Membrane protein, RDD family n=1 Tax=Burkholderia lata (strain ATCC 17760 / DSM 23089 / LMG 22485 / NCIMB 9086 / R18194 / 383) TaxID=482957 RepID=Q391A8_BURL3|nr:RDD family protein [Burkholderia lata]ABB12958.1 membrane protein, RDD family [Burkholderia lata]
MERNTDQESHGAAGFWRRTAAFAIDSILLGLIGLAIAILFFDALSTIGEWGRLIGFLIGSIYFGLLEGGHRHQSLGKRVMNIRVADSATPDGSGPGYVRAWARYALIAVPLTLGGISFIDLPALHDPGMAWLATANGTIVFFWGLALLYLFVFNRPSRQSVQDLLTASRVVHVAAPVEDTAPVGRKHWAILAVLGLLLFVGSRFATTRLIDDDRMADIHQIQRATSTVPGVIQSGVWIGNRRVVGPAGQPPQAIATLTVLTSTPALMNKVGATAVAHAALASSAWLRQQDLVNVVSVRAVNLGIATWRTQFFMGRSPAEWTAMAGTGST